MATSVVRIGVESTGGAYRGPAKGSVATRGGPDRCAGPVRSGEETHGTERPGYMRATVSMEDRIGTECRGSV